LLVATLAGFALTQVATMATTVFLHRSLAHRALTLHPAARLVFRALVWLTVGIKPREWAAVHRKHHAHTDTPEDPHSPAQLGWVRVQLTNAALYRRVARDGRTVGRYARDVPPDAWDRALFDRPFLGLGIGVALLALVLRSPWWGLYAAAFHAVAYLMLNAAVNAVGHHFGRRPHPGSATNLQWLALLTSGEGLHNNHHAAPTSARLSLARGELDPGWWCIRALRRLGLARLRHAEPVLAA
jgi:stearoyl-CoA desaturase (delta-9 desaturase)